MQVAVIGAAGKMGTWFCRYFAQRNGHDVLAFDVKPFRISEVKNAATIPDCVKNADLVIVCVPVRQMTTVILECAKWMKKKGAALAEISSVKARTLPTLKKTRQDINTLSCHPMFGPGANEKNHLKVLAIPVRNKTKEMDMIRRIFAGMTMIELPDARTHDKAIAIVLGLTYFMNVVFACMLAREDLINLNKIGGTTFTIQALLAQSVMTDEPDLIAALLRDNPQIAKYMRAYMGEATSLLSARETILAPRLKITKKRLQDQVDLGAAYKRMYNMIGQLENSPSL